MFHIIDTYSKLGQSHIEGIEVQHSRFQLLIAGMKKKSYDPLEHRKSDYDSDFEEFKRGAADIEVSLHSAPVLPHWKVLYIYNVGKQ